MSAARRFRFSIEIECYSRMLMLKIIQKLLTIGVVCLLHCIRPIVDARKYVYNGIYPIFSALTSNFCSQINVFLASIKFFRDNDMAFFFVAQNRIKKTTIGFQTEFVFLK